MKVLLIIFVIVATLMALTTMAFTVTDMVKEYRKNKEQQAD